jgi:hypothetical protein
MEKRKLLLLLLLCLFVVGVTVSMAVASPNKYGASVYQEVAHRISFNDANFDGIDDNGLKTVHSTTKDALTGLGQDNKL